MRPLRPFIPVVRLVVGVVVGHLWHLLLANPGVTASQVRFTRFTSAQNRSRLTAKIGTFQFVCVCVVVLVARKYIQRKLFFNPLRAVSKSMQRKCYHRFAVHKYYVAYF